MPRVRNKEYDKAYLIKWRENNPERVKELSIKSYWKHREKRLQERREKYKNDEFYRLKHRAENRQWLYGITQQQYEALEKLQNGVCAVCNQKQQSKKTNKLYVDHSHETGKVRGLLCQKCNSALGLLEENVDILQNLINYLNNYAIQIKISNESSFWGLSRERNEI